MKPGGELNGEEFRFASQEPPVIRVVIGYDTREAALSATKLARTVGRTLPPGFDLQCRLWRFDILQLPEAAKEAIADAKAADVIVYSAREPSAIAQATLQWLEAWLPAHAGDGPALVVLVEAASPAALGKIVGPQLVQAAEHGEVELFYVAGNGLLERYCPAREWLQQRATQITPTLHTIFNHTHARASADPAHHFTGRRSTPPG